MGRLIVFEETGEVRRPRDGEYFSVEPGDLIRSIGVHSLNERILRRLTDEEVAARLHPADSDRARFVRETAALVMAHQFAMWTVAEIADGDHSVSYSEGAIDQMVKAAESLAAKVF